MTARRIIQTAISDGSGCISFQVVQEVLNVITHKLDPPASPADARLLLDGVLYPLWRVMPTHALYQRSLELQERFRYGFYDSLILAAAVAAGCTRLYSEDLQEGQRIENLTIRNPFYAASLTRAAATS